jgi:hypothetical protein
VSDAGRERAPSRALLRALLVLAAAGFTAGAAGLGAWLWTRNRPVSLEDLQPSQRQRLAERFLKESPGVFQTAWYEPQIGYTLRPQAKLTVWHDTFTSNEIGYRTGRLIKNPKVYRIVVLGDSWAYGMGIRQAESFPEVLARLVAEARPNDRPVQVRTIALPGYNLFNSIGAFEFWEQALAADAVVVVPSGNDEESAPRVSPRGELFAGFSGPGDLLGWPHDFRRPDPWIYDGFGSLDRWRMAFARVRALEQHLRERRVPMALFFVARWRSPLVHRFIAEAGLASPYAIVPERLTLGEWLEPEERHGNARANVIYARILHRLLERSLGWPALPASDADAESGEVFAALPPRAEWEAAANGLLREATRRFVPASFAPGPAAAEALAGPCDPATGVIGRATTVLVHPPAGTPALEVRLRRIPELPELYPLPLTLTIPSAGGGTRARVVVSADGPAEQSFRIAVPPDRDGDQALEVVVVSERVAASPGSLVGLSVAIASIRAAG